MANTNRTKGHNAERKYAKIFKELGYAFCKTSRYASRLHDDAGIDLVNVPINIQIKAGKQRGMNISTVLQYVKDRIKELFPPNSVEAVYPTILIHEKEVGRGNKRKDTDSIVSMTFKDFKKLTENYDTHNTPK